MPQRPLYDAVVRALADTPNQSVNTSASQSFAPEARPHPPLPMCTSTANRPVDTSTANLPSPPNAPNALNESNIPNVANPPNTTPTPSDSTNVSARFHRLVNNSHLIAGGPVPTPASGDPVNMASMATTTDAVESLVSKLRTGPEEGSTRDRVQKCCEPLEAMSALFAADAPIAKEQRAIAQQAVARARSRPITPRRFVHSTAIPRNSLWTPAQHLVGAAHNLAEEGRTINDEWAIQLLSDKLDRVTSAIKSLEEKVDAIHPSSDPSHRVNVNDAFVSAEITSQRDDITVLRTGAEESKSQFDALQAEVASLKAIIASQDERIKALESVSKESASPEQDDGVASERDRIVSSHEDEINDLRQRYFEKEEYFAKLTEHLSGTQQALFDEERKVTWIYDDLAAAKERVAVLEAAEEQHQHQLDEKQRKIDELGMELHAATMALEERIEQVMWDAEERESAKTAAARAQHQVELNRKQREINEYRVEVTRVDVALRSANDQLASMTSKYNEANDRVKSLEEKNTEQHQHLQAKQCEINVLKRSLHVKQTALELKETELSALQQTHERKVEEYENFKRAVRAQVDELVKAQTDGEVLTSKLEDNLKQGSSIDKKKDRVPAVEGIANHDQQHSNKKHHHAKSSSAQRATSSSSLRAGSSRGFVHPSRIAPLDGPPRRDGRNGQEM